MGLLPTTPTAEIFGRRDWRALLVRDYQPTAQRLTQAYARVIARLQPYADALTRDLEAMASTGAEITPDMLRGLGTYRQLLARVEVELNDFAALVRNEATTVTEGAIPLGRDAALDMAQWAAGRGAALVQSSWLRPDPDILNQLIAAVDGDAFRARWAQFGANGAQQLGDLLLTGVAQGLGPLQIARLWTQWQPMPYAWAENATRTAQLTTYRRASHATYRANSRIVEGWYWVSALDPRVCMSCWDQHGSFHANDEELNDHHRGRCTPVPKIRGYEYANPIQSGPEVFEGLDEATQRRIMGRGLFDAWKRGEVAWGEFSHEYTDPIWGVMMRAATQRELGVR